LFRIKQIIFSFLFK